MKKSLAWVVAALLVLAVETLGRAAVRETWAREARERRRSHGI